MRRIAAVVGCVLVTLSGVAQAEERSSIPPQGSPYSFVYNILDIHETRTSGEVVRLYRVTDKGSGTALLLHVRPAKATVGETWKLGTSLEAIEAVFVSDNKVTIRGSDSSQRTVTCTAEFRLDDGVLAKQLVDKGCRE
jgi:hypothetical protein